MIFSEVIAVLLGDPTVTFCEVPTGGLIERPWYLLSNLPYFLVGFYLLFGYAHSQIARVLGIATLAIGFFSSFYDITYTFGAQLLDLGGMFFFIMLLLALNIERYRGGLKNTHKSWFHPLLITFLVICLMFVLYLWKGVLGNYLFALLALLAISSEYFAYSKNKTTNYKNWKIAIALFLVGSAIWMLDGLHIWCSPVAILNGRAIFHYFTSIVMLFLFYFYRQFENR